VSVEFLWDGKAQPTRGPKPALTLDRIADTAIAIADAEGLAAVSMQRVAADLGKTKMSLYRYLPGKAELVAVMLERGLGEAPELTADGWRAALTQWCEHLLRVYRAHPWAQEVTLGARPLGPYEVGWMERALAVLPPGLTGAERLDVVAVLAMHARTPAAQAGSRQSEAELTAAMAAVLTTHADRFPALAAALADVDPAAQGQAFAFGLARILDGLEVLIGTR
jgi:AcrR family transcriptional regulator